MERIREQQTGRVVRLDPNRVKPFAEQPRKRFRGIAKLAESIRLVGQITPIVVTACGEPEYDAELVDGERRLKACTTAGIKIKAIFTKDRGKAARFAASVAANFCRQPHDCMEIMEAVRALHNQGHAQEEIAGIFGKAISWVSQHASLAKLAPEVQEELKVAADGARREGHRLRAKGSITLSVALLLVGLPHDQQVAAMRKIVDGRMGMTQARAMVYRIGKKTGVRMRPIHPQRYCNAVFGAVETCCHTLDRYLDMPGAEIQRLLKSASRSERHSLAKMVDRLCENLIAFGDALVK